MFQLRTTSLNNGTAQEYAHFEDFNLSTNAPLPIQLESFDGICENNQKIIRWTTSSERNNKSFILEKWINKEWTFFKEIEGKGNSNERQEYSVVDDSLEEESYYLLSQIDFDGTKETFDPIGVQCSKKQNFMVFPNPADQFISIQGFGKDSNILIFNSFGQQVFEKQNCFMNEKIDVSYLASGVYFIEILQENKRETQKFIVQH